MSPDGEQPVAGGRARDPRLALACTTASLLAIVGVFGTWRSAGPVSLDGVQGPHDGWLVVLFALFALAGAGSLARSGWLGIVTVLLCAGAILAFALSNVFDDEAVLGGTSGWGVWLTVTAAVVLAAAAVVAAVRRLRPRRAARPQSDDAAPQSG